VGGLIFPTSQNDVHANIILVNSPQRNRVNSRFLTKDEQIVYSSTRRLYITGY